MCWPCMARTRADRLQPSGAWRTGAQHIAPGLKGPMLATPPIHLQAAITFVCDTWRQYAKDHLGILEGELVPTAMKGCMPQPASKHTPPLPPSQQRPHQLRQQRQHPQRLRLLAAGGWGGGGGEGGTGRVCACLLHSTGAGPRLTAPTDHVNRAQAAPRPSERPAQVAVTVLRSVLRSAVRPALPTCLPAAPRCC